jgi:DNA polymerase III epsilon subunit family exonuclease
MEFSPLPQQLRAIEAPTGPVLVVAGPGAGKTFCLIGRVKHLITAKGFAPGRICAVTFTNKAAEEIALRLKNELRERADEITRGTLHALCLGILREHAEAAGLRRGFGVADEQYQRTILARLGIHPKRRSALLTLFSRRRLQGYRLTAGDQQVYDAYNDLLNRRGMLDFDGLISRTARLLMKQPDIAAALAARWDYLLVDEFQDLNPAQYAILRHLTAPHRNFFAVGDDEQSIFSWTGADPLILKRFRDDYAIAEPIILDHNHRCSRQILETARRVLAENLSIFAKRLTAERTSEHDVAICGFPDEAAEALWLLGDLEADRAATGKSLGQYAILYRRHRLGEYLEGELLRAGIPCRLARGRAIAEDHVVGYVIAALSILRNRADGVAMESFAERVFPEPLLADVRSFAASRGLEFLDAARALVKLRPRNDPDTKRLWKFVFYVENLPALAQSHPTLAALVEELLSQSIGPYKNALEDRHDELRDPADIAAAVLLAERLHQAIATDQPIVIEPMGGLEIALRGMLIEAGFRRVPVTPQQASDDCVLLTKEDGGEEGLALVLFKALQLMHARGIERAVPRFVAWDLETTDQDPQTCDVIEIGAARVVDGAIVDRFHSLVRPPRSIPAASTKVHGRTDADVANAPTFAEVWPAFRAFVGDDVLVAHNGQYFDVPVLRRVAGRDNGAERLVFYDTLPLARSLSRDSAKLTDLAARFGIEAGRAHHALDDAITLAGVFTELERQRVVRARKSVLLKLLDYLGLALALEPQEQPSDERRVLFEIARIATLGRFGDSLNAYAVERAQTGVGSPMVDELIDRLGGQDLMNRLRAEPDPAQRYPSAVARLQTLIGPDGNLPVQEALPRVLERVALSSSEGVEVSPDRVTLLTLHSTKGLEFSRVYIVGVEDYELPGYYQIVDQREDEIQEARRLLYVGMTRAQDRLVLTRVEQRFGREAGGSRFLGEMGLAPLPASPGLTPGVGTAAAPRTVESQNSVATSVTKD